LLERAPDPRVINVASIAATFPGAGQSVYAVSKALLLEWTRRMAHSADVRSRFYAVSPGPVATDMTRSSAYYAQRDLTKLAPVQAATTPQDVAEIIVRMAQARGDLYVGNNWVIDGGFTLAHK
jgi:3-oxoacyl-[acyl-carrier protein] reductase